MKCGCKCAAHGRPCEIVVAYKDDRQEVVERLKKTSTSRHNRLSKHLCDLCIRERDEDREPGFYAIDPFDKKAKPRILIRHQTERRWDNRGYY